MANNNKNRSQPETSQLDWLDLSSNAILTSTENPEPSPSRMVHPSRRMSIIPESHWPKNTTESTIKNTIADKSLLNPSSDQPKDQNICQDKQTEVPNYSSAQDRYEGIDGRTRI